MSREQASARIEQLEVWSKTKRLLDYDADPDRPGRPLMVLLAGASLALLALAFIIMAIYRTWVLEENSADRGFTTISLLFLVHIAGVYVFSYGYELYDHARAMRMTAVIALVSFGAIVAVIAALMLAMRVKSPTSLLPSEGEGALVAEGTSFAPFAAPVTPTLGRFERPEEPAQPFAITCIGCGARFEPAPPAAICPTCGRENVRAG